MTDPTEQTVADALACGCRLAEHVQGLCGCRERLDALGLEASIPVVRLREDLAIAARVRSCPQASEHYGLAGGWAFVGEGAARAEGWDACLAYLLNGERDG